VELNVAMAIAESLTTDQFLKDTDPNKEALRVLYHHIRQLTGADKSPCDRCQMGWGRVGYDDQGKPSSTSCHQTCTKLKEWVDRRVNETLPRL